MGTPVGNLGGMAVVEETVWGTTPAVPAWVWQHPVKGGLKNIQPVITPNLLSYAAHTNRKYQGKFAEGDYSVGFDFEKAVIGLILGLAGTDVANVFQLGGGSVPDVNAVSALQCFGGGGATPANHHEWIYKGMKPNALRFEFPADSNGILTLVGIGKEGVKTTIGSSETPAPPDELNVMMPSDLGTVLIGVGETWEQEVCLHSATVEVAVAKTGFERRCMNGNMKEPIDNGRPEVSFSLELDLDDDAANDTISILQRLEDGLPLGDVQLGTSLLLRDGFAQGEYPDLDEGLIDLTLGGLASRFDVTTTV